MTPSNPRNAISVPAAGAAGQTTASGNPSGVLPVSALAEALVNFGGQAGGEQTQVQPGSLDPGAAQPEPGAPGEGGEPITAPEGSGEPGAGGEPGQETDPNLETQAGGETTTGDPEGELPPGVQRRFGQFQSKIRELETKLESAEQRLNTTSVPTDNRPTVLDNVTDLAELTRRQELSELGLEEVDALLSKLPIAPTRVEQYLRQNGVVLKDEEGNEDFSQERMADVLANAKQSFRQTLRAIPRRRDYLQQYAAAHAQVVKAIPWVADRTDERHAFMGSILQQFPGLKAQPNYEYWVACAIEGHQTIQKRLVAPKNGAGTVNGKTASRPNTGGGGVARSLNPAKAKVEAARQAVLKEGSKRALGAFFETSGFIK